MDPGVERVLSEARTRGLDVRDKLGGGGLCGAWAIGDALVMRIPRALPVDPERFVRGYGPLVVEIDSPTGPFDVRCVGNPRWLFAAALDRQREVTRGPL